MSDALLWLEGGLALSGLLILLFAARAFMSRHAWSEGAEYEMLDLPVPQEGAGGVGSQTEDGVDGAVGEAGGAAAAAELSSRERAVRPGEVGLEDRVVRFGFVIALNYLAFTWFGFGSPAMVAFVVLSLYALVTACVGRDPVYTRFGISTGA